MVMKSAVASRTWGAKQKRLPTLIGRTPDIAVREAMPLQTSAAQGGEIVPAGKFKATCLQLLDRSAEGETITITKRGKVVARLVPPESEKPKRFIPLLGRMKGKGKILGDIVSPDFKAWGMPDPRKK